MITKWPDPVFPANDTYGPLGAVTAVLVYERARADAAMERLKVAIDVLCKLAHPDSVCQYIANEALSQIDMPEEK